MFFDNFLMQKKFKILVFPFCLTFLSIKPLLFNVQLYIKENPFHGTLPIMNKKLSD